MWRITIFLILLIQIISIPAEASDVILGNVVSVDRENGEMTVRLSESSDSSKEISGQEDKLSPKIIKVYFTPDQFRENIREGKLIRLWGNFESDSQNTFKATHIGSGSQRDGNDPTGVRRRLGKKKGMGGRRHGGKGRTGK